MKTAVLRAAAKAGILIPGLFERIGSTRLWQNHRFRAAAKLESLSRVSLRESEAHGFAYLTQNSTFGRRLVENRRFESCRQAGILISGLFERIGSTRLCQNHRLRAAARLESLSRVSLRESEIARLCQNHRFRAATKLESLSRVSLRDSETPGFCKTAVLELPPGWNPYLGSL